METIFQYKYNLSYYEVPDLLNKLGGKSTYTQLIDAIKHYYITDFVISTNIEIFVANRFIDSYIAIVFHPGKDKRIRYDYLLELKKEKYERTLREYGVEYLVDLPEKLLLEKNRKPHNSIHPIALEKIERTKKKRSFIKFGEPLKHLYPAYVYYKIPTKMNKLRGTAILQALPSEPIEIIV